MISYWKTREFRALQAVWYKALERAEFHDIEASGARIHPNNARNRDFEAVLTYYRIAEGFLNSHKFSTPRDKKIWKLHCEGLTVREIVKLVGIQRNVVNLTIRAHERLAGIKK